MMMTLVRWTLVTVGTAAYLALAILGWGGWTAFFSHPARLALAVILAVMAGVSLFARRQPEPGSARGPRQPLGHRSVGADRALGRLSAGLHGPAGVLDPRRRSTALAWCRALRGRWGSATMAHLCARPPVQRLVAIQPGHTLVTSGVYGVIRHRAIWGCLSTRWGGASPAVREWACCGRRWRSHPSSRACVPKSGCCARSLAPSMAPTAPGPHG